LSCISLKESNGHFLRQNCSFGKPIMVLDLYPSSILDGEGTPTFGPEIIDGICSGVVDAIKGFGTDEKALLLVMGKQTPEERCVVHLRYKEMFDKELKSVIEDECGRKPFGRAMKYLSVPPDIAECIMLHEACKG
jgi:Annexin